MADTTVVVVGGIHRVGNETAGDHPGYLGGAIASGRRVAREVIEALASIDFAGSLAGGESR